MKRRFMNDDDRALMRDAKRSPREKPQPIRVCARRDAICPNGLSCSEPCAKERY